MPHASSGRRLFLAALAAGLLCGAGCKEEEPKSLEEALARRDYEAALRFCEDYFSRPDRDPEHTRLMRTIYRGAFVRWSLGRRGEVTRSAAKRIAAFRRYVGDGGGAPAK